MKKNFTCFTYLSCLLLFSGHLSVAQVTPIYDDCGYAVLIPVTVSATCTGVTDFTTVAATPSTAGTVPVPGCGNFTDGVTPDVWFKFTTNTFSVYRINVSPSLNASAADIAVEVYSGGCGGTLVPVGCDDNSNGANMPALIINSAGPGTDYYVRVWSNNGTLAGNFRICVLIIVTDGVEDISGNSIHAYPNPFDNYFSVRLPDQATSGFVKVRNTLGDIVLTKRIDDSEFDLDASGLAKGIYILEMETGHERFTKKIVRM